MRERRPAPLWFVVLAAFAGALLVRAFFATHGASSSAPAAPPVQQAFLGLLLALGGWIWNAVQAAGRVTLEILEWSVKALWAFATRISNGLRELGKDTLAAFRKSWHFLKWTYDDVLKPAWRKFWELFDRVHSWLEQTFRPIINFLRTVRDEILKFYATWIRPVLDIIDATRAILRVLERLGLKWAARLDHQLGAIETWVNRQFAAVLSKVNELVNLVDRVATAGGLLQRVAFIRTLERDITYAARALSNARLKPLSPAETTKKQILGTAPAYAKLRHDLGAYLESGDGDAAPRIAESSAQLSLRLRQQIQD